MIVKTHDLASGLSQLAKLLRSGQDVEISQLSTGSFIEGKNRDDLVVSLTALVDLARVEKEEWLALIDDYDFPIKARPRDASRDILWKLVAFLVRNPRAQRLLKSSFAHRKFGKSSPELTRALGLLLRDDS